MSPQVSPISAALKVGSFSDPLDEVAAAGLADLLPEHIATRRWYRAKTRTIAAVVIEDAIGMPGTAAYLLILQLKYQDGDSDRYILPVSVEQGSSERSEVMARLVSQDGAQGILFSALEEAAFRDALLNAIVCEEKLTGRAGVLSASRTRALAAFCGSERSTLESFVSRAEQSNTSVIYRDRYILKLFRKLEAGINPDLEIGRFLTERKFRNTPAVLGTIEYRAGQTDEVYAAGILQQFVPNRGDAWKYTLESLEDFFANALASKRLPPRRASDHPLDLIAQEIPSEVRTFIGPYLESAALLGRRTAEMHKALAHSSGSPDFDPEPFTAKDLKILHEDLAGQAQIAFDLLRRKQATLSDEAASDAGKLLDLQSRIDERFAAMGKTAVTTVRIRHHGDYHLGQVLYTGQDFMIIDFEGEPARPLADRRLKSLAMRDVAGMIRSFQYAAFAALFGQIPGIPDDPDTRRRVEQWAAAWNAYVSSTYLRAYFEAAQHQAFVPAAWGARRLLLDAFLLQKALYELAYELNNRPAWLPIPLRGILSLIN